MTWIVENHPDLGSFTSPEVAVAAAWDATPPGGERPAVLDSVSRTPWWARQLGIDADPGPFEIIVERDAALDEEDKVLAEMSATVAAIALETGVRVMRDTVSVYRDYLSAGLHLTVRASTR